MYTDYIEDNEENYYADDDNGSNNGFDKEKLKKIAVIILAFVVLVLLVILMVKGCSKKETPPKTVAETSSEVKIVVNKLSLSLKENEIERIRADVIGESLNGVFTYMSRDTAVAEVSDEGVVTAISEGQTVIDIQYKYQDVKTKKNKTQYGTCNIIVTSNPSKIESISFGQEEISVNVGASLLLQVSVTPIDARTDEIEFESEAPEIVSVDQDGRITAVSVGTTAVIARAQDKSASVTIRVTEKGGIQINPTDLRLIGLANGLKIGSTAKVIYNLLPENATNNALTWKSSDPSIATVDEDGIVTGISAGTCQIIATTTNGISSSISITVESDTVPVESIVINGETAITMKLGGTRLLRYTVLPDNATDKKVTYTTSNTSVIFIASNGVMAAMGEGSCFITITSNDGSKTAVLNVTVISNVTNTSNNTSSDSSGTSVGTEKTSSDYTTDTGGSSSSNSGGSSSSDSSSSNSSRTVVSGDTSSNACSVNSFSIHSNQDGAVTSNYRFEQASPFTKSSPVPGLKVDRYDDCIKTATYSMWYNKSQPNVGTGSSINGTLPKLNGTLLLNKGDGYYYIIAKITAKDGGSYHKYYYAIVQKDSSSSTSTTAKITVSQVSKGQSTSGSWCSYKITKTGSVTKVKKAYSYLSGEDCRSKIVTSTNEYKSFPATTGNLYWLKSNDKGNNKVWVCFRGYNGSTALPFDTIVTRTITSSGGC